MFAGLRVLKNLSVIRRCPLLGGTLTKMIIYGTRHFVRYSWLVRYFGCSLLGGFIVLILLGFTIDREFNFRKYTEAIVQRCSIKKVFLGGDYMIPVCRDEISPRPAGTDLTLRLHVEIKFRPGKAGQFPPGICLDLYAISLNFSL